MIRFKNQHPATKAVPQNQKNFKSSAFRLQGTQQGCRVRKKFNNSLFNKLKQVIISTFLLKVYTFF